MLLIDFSQCLLFRAKLLRACFERYQLATILFQRTHQLSFLSCEISQKKVSVQKSLQQQRIFEGVFSDFSKLCLTIVLDTETVGWNVTNFTLLLGFHYNIRAERFFIAIAHPVGVFAVNNDTGRTSLLRFKFIVERQAMSERFEGRRFASASAADEAIQVVTEMIDLTVETTAGYVHSQNPRNSARNGRNGSDARFGVCESCSECVEAKFVQLKPCQNLSTSSCGEIFEAMRIAALNLREPGAPGERRTLLSRFSDFLSFDPVLGPIVRWGIPIQMGRIVKFKAI